MSDRFTATLTAGVPIPGPPGPQGPPGTPGPYSPVFIYRADTTSHNPSDPGTGLMRWNAAEPADVTALCFDRLTVDGNDVSLLFALAQPTMILLQEASFALNRQLWEVTGPFQSMPDWFQIPVRFVPAASAGDMMKKPLMQVMVVLASSDVTALIRSAAPSKPHG